MTIAAISRIGPKIYTPEQIFEICDSQLDVAVQREPRDILDLEFGTTQDWSEIPGMRCTRPMEWQETGARIEEEKSGNCGAATK